MNLPYACLPRSGGHTPVPGLVANGRRGFLPEAMDMEMRRVAGSNGLMNRAHGPDHLRQKLGRILAEGDVPPQNEQLMLLGSGKTPRDSRPIHSSPIVAYDLTLRLREQFAHPARHGFVAASRRRFRTESVDVEMQRKAGMDGLVNGAHRSDHFCHKLRLVPGEGGVVSQNEYFVRPGCPETAGGFRVSHASPVLTDDVALRACQQLTHPAGRHDGT